MMNILLLEDDSAMAHEIATYLKHANYDCDCVYDGSLVNKQMNLKTYDLFILDVNVPGTNGFEICKQIREKDKQTPILMLTAFGAIDDKVLAFNNGADDYLIKPFHFEELSLRIKSLLRRKSHPQLSSNEIVIGDLKVNFEEMNAERNGLKINLSPKEFKLLNILIQANGRVLSKNQIADELWDYHIETNQNAIEVYINFLRKKIDKDFEKKLIHTKIGFGYYLKQEA